MTQTKTNSSDPVTRVAIIGPDAMMRKKFAELINNTPGHRCVSACATGKDALTEIPKQRPDIVLTDFHLPDESGIEWAARLAEKSPDLRMVMVMFFNAPTSANHAAKNGAGEAFFKQGPLKGIVHAVADARMTTPPRTDEMGNVEVRFHPDLPVSREIASLTAREMEILKLLADGLSNKEIAHEAGISVGTVRTHVTHMLVKLNARGRTEAAAKYWASRKGALPVIDETAAQAQMV